MFNFEVEVNGDETVSKLVSDDCVYISYWRADLWHAEINVYITRLDKSGLIRRDYFPIFGPLTIVDFFTILYAGAK